MDNIPSINSKKSELIKYCDFYNLSKKGLKKDIHHRIEQWMNTHSIFIKLIHMRNITYLRCVDNIYIYDKFVWDKCGTNEWYVLGILKDAMILPLTKEHVIECISRGWKYKIPDILTRNEIHESYRTKRIQELMDI